MVQEWYRDGCICPKMDNDDAGHHYYLTEGCPLHFPARSGTYIKWRCDGCGKMCDTIIKTYLQRAECSNCGLKFEGPADWWCEVDHTV